MALVFSDVDKTELHIQFAERRAGEMVEMARQGKPDKVLMLTEQVAKHSAEVCVAEEAKKGEEKEPKLLVPAPTATPAPPREAEAYNEKDAEELKIVLSQSRTESLDALRNALDKVYVVGKTKKVEEKEPKVIVPAPTPTPAPPREAETYDGKGAEELKIVLSQSRAESLDALRNALDKAPEELKPSLKRAIENIREDYNKTISIIGSGSSP